MGRNKKGFQAATSPGNRVDQKKTFKLSEEQTKRLYESGELASNSFSNIIRSCFDDRFDQNDFFRKNPNLSMQLSDFALIVGDGVNASDVTACLQAIIDNDPWPAIRITPKAESCFQAFFGEENLDKPLELIREYTQKLIDDQIHMYFLHVFQRKAIYRMSSLINHSMFATVIDKINAHNFAGSFQGSEKAWLSYIVGLSARLRFAMYCCQKIEIFGSRGSASASFQPLVKMARNRYGFND